VKGLEEGGVLFIERGVINNNIDMRQDFPSRHHPEVSKEGGMKLIMRKKKGGVDNLRLRIKSSASRHRQLGNSTRISSSP
jgi:hypothetical protein